MNQLELAGGGSAIERLTRCLVQFAQTGVLGGELTADAGIGGGQLGVDRTDLLGDEFLGRTAAKAERPHGQNCRDRGGRLEFQH